MEKINEVIMNHKFIRILGFGGFSCVYEAINLENNLKCAIKVIKDCNINRQRLSYSMNEIEILKKLTHNNIIRYYNHYILKNQQYVIMEYLQGQTLFNVKLNKFFYFEHIMSYRNKNTYLQEKELLHIINQILIAIDYIHGKNIIHCDLKTDNILMTEDFTIKLIDFGLSEVCHNQMNFNSNCVGTLQFTAPEILLKNLYDYSSDIFSLGVILYYFLFNCYPIKFSNINEYREKIKEFKIDFGKRSPYSTLIVEFCEKILQIERRKRPNTYETILLFDELKSKIKEESVDILIETAGLKSEKDKTKVNLKKYCYKLEFVCLNNKFLKKSVAVVEQKLKTEIINRYSKSQKKNKAIHSKVVNSIKIIENFLFIPDEKKVGVTIKFSQRKQMKKDIVNPSNCLKLRNFKLTKIE